MKGLEMDNPLFADGRVPKTILFYFDGGGPTAVDPRLITRGWMFSDWAGRIVEEQKGPVFRYNQDWDVVFTGSMNDETFMAVRHRFAAHDGATKITMTIECATADERAAAIAIHAAVFGMKPKEGE